MVRTLLQNLFPIHFVGLRGLLRLFLVQEGGEVLCVNLKVVKEKKQNSANGQTLSSSALSLLKTSDFSRSESLSFDFSSSLFS